MKYIRNFSDLHLEFDAKRNDKLWRPIPLETDKETVLILAGDIWYGMQSIDWLETFCYEFEHVFIVLGNHDYYNNLVFQLQIDYEIELYKRNLNVTLLDKTCKEIGDYLFIGATLWTNMDNNPYLETIATHCMRSDFNYIKMDFNEDLSVIPFKQHNWLAENRKDFDYINIVTKNNKDKKVIVVTHHGCSYQSVHEKYKGDIANGFFVSDYSDFILDNENIKYWFHGHVHNNFQYDIGTCKVKVNPRGYITKYGTENPEFDEIALTTLD